MAKSKSYAFLPRTFMHLLKSLGWLGTFSMLCSQCFRHSCYGSSMQSRIWPQQHKSLTSSVAPPLQALTVCFMKSISFHCFFSKIHYFFIMLVPTFLNNFSRDSLFMHRMPMVVSRLAHSSSKQSVCTDHLCLLPFTTCQYEPVEPTCKKCTCH